MEDSEGRPILKFNQYTTRTTGKKEVSCDKEISLQMLYNKLSAVDDALQKIDFFKTEFKRISATKIGLDEENIENVNKSLENALFRIETASKRVTGKFVDVRVTIACCLAVFFSLLFFGFAVYFWSSAATERDNYKEQLQELQQRVKLEESERQVNELVLPGNNKKQRAR